MKDGQIQSINKYEPGIWVINAGIYKRNDTEIVLHDWPKPGTISVYFNGLRLMPGEDFIVVEHSVWIQKIDALIVNKANIIIDYMV